MASGVKQKLIVFDEMNLEMDVRCPANISSTDLISNLEHCQRADNLVRSFSMSQPQMRELRMPTKIVDLLGISRDYGFALASPQG